MHKNLINIFFRIEEIDNHKVIHFCGIKFKFYIEKNTQITDASSYLNENIYDIILPIGNDCLTAHCLNRLNLRKSSYPFDWLYSEYDFFPIAANIIINKFKGFLNLFDLQCRGNSIRHNSTVYFNRKNKLIFLHDFKEKPPFIIQYFSVLMKYKRRIKRIKRSLTNAKILLLNIQQDKTEDKIFIEKLAQIQKVYNNNNIDLLVLQNDDTKNENEYEVQILTPNIKKILYNNDEKFSPVKDDPWFRNEKMSLKLIKTYCKIKDPLMQKVPTISVVMPTYNAEKYLNEAIESILNQTYSDFEFLIIDDNSKDNTREIIKSYAAKDSRIKLIDGPCKGLAAALNVGIREAKGEYIARMDADDISLPERFQKQIEYFKQHPEISLLGTWQEHFGAMGYEHRPPVDPYIAKTALLFDCDMCHSTVMFRKKDFTDNNLFYPEDSVQEDFALWSKAIGKINVANLRKILGKYRLSESNITNAKTTVLDTYEAEQSAQNLLNYFQITLSKDDLMLVKRRNNPYWRMEQSDKINYQKKLDNLYKLIEKQNSQTHFMPPKKLHEGLIYCWTLMCGDEYHIKTIYRKKNNIIKRVLQNIFSIQNSTDKTYKIFTVLGIQIKINRCNLPKYKKFNKNKIKSEILKVDCVSFDIFDTLLLRPYVNPVDLFKHIEKNFDCKGFAQSRINAEKIARQNIKQTTFEEISYDSIYEIIDNQYKHLKSIELEYEEKLIFQNTEIYELYKHALENNKKIFFTSDMYLSKAFIEKILHKNGYNKYDELYISSSTNKTKLNGSLYNVIKGKYPLKSYKIMHIGDNFKSDFINAKLNGLKAYYYPKIIDNYFYTNPLAQKYYEQNKENLSASIILMQLAINTNQYINYWGKVGYYYGGPVCYGFTKWIYKEMQKDQINNAFFVARDGYSLIQIFNLLGKDIKASYIYAPRLLCTISSIYQQKPDINKIKHIINYFRQDFDVEMETEFNKLKTDEEKYNFYKEHEPQFNTWIQTHNYKYKTYINNHINGTENCGIVDSVTGNLSAQRLIQSTLNDNNIIGYYWHVDYSPTKNFSNHKYRQYSKYQNNLINDWNFMELLMSAPEPPIIDIDNNNKPVYKKNLNKYEIYRNIISKYISDYTVLYSKDLLKRFDNINVEFNIEEIANWINFFTKNPDNNDKKHFKKVKHAIDENHENYIRLFPQWRSHHNKKIIKFINNINLLGNNQIKEN